ncbi:hypothetical protein LNTAR_22739 [Lentisphaera araneosa HTCC2155]|jgi:hypothetical protein|uniref:Uncharacterized protein n=1 Tax=Lentisphaera araneosa HTCC2155 TaxID=313628 RepID=A6DGD9_9BACT|nr:hypothetical protein [Lentisphaera araneosa]EDM29256.1 hypothetical protein LNTAR_22739 [Lentisphaera araneosa HTCC2155]
MVKAFIPSSKNNLIEGIMMSLSVSEPFFNNDSGAYREILLQFLFTEEEEE